MRDSLLIRTCLSAVVLIPFLTAGAMGAPQDLPKSKMANQAKAYTDRELSQGHEYLQKSAEACGGLDVLKNVENYEMTCTITSAMQGAMKYREIKIFPDKLAQFVKTPSQTQEMYYNGTDGWMVMGGAPKALPPIQAKNMGDQIKRDQFYLLTHADDENLVVAYKGEATFMEKQALRLEVKLNASETYSIFLDPESYLIKGMRQETMSAMGPAMITIQLFDYKDFGGIKLPSRIEQHVGDQTVSISDISYTMNGEIDSGMFEKPEGM